MTAPSSGTNQTMSLSSGELTDPEVGRQWSHEAAAILGEMASRAETAVGEATRKGLSQERVARLTNALQLVMSAKNEFDQAEQEFVGDISTRDHRRATGAGGREGYLD